MGGGEGGIIIRMLERFFKVSERGSSIATEALAGCTTFATMSYVIFVQPAVLSMAGMDFGAVMAATCLSAAFGSILMGLLSNLPIAQAPGMGQNFFFAFTVCGATAMGGYGLTWQEALGTVFVSGLLFIIFTAGGLRDRVMRVMPASLKYGIVGGIGLFIALIGLRWGGVVEASPATLVKLGNLHQGPAPMVLITVVLIALMMMLKVRGALLVGIAFAAVWSLAAGYTAWHGVVAAPPSLAPTLFQLSVVDAFGKPHIWVIIFTFFVLDFFDSVGTITAIAHEAHVVKDGVVPRGDRALLADAIATVAGALLGTSTVTSYIESSTGVADGGRTGLAAVVTGLLFLFALFLYPLAQMIGGGYEASPGILLYPVIAPAMVIVGSFMLPLALRVEWQAPQEAVPAFLTMIAMPFTFSITEGIAIGMIAYSLLHFPVTGLPRTNPIIHILAAAFILRYAFLA